MTDARHPEALGLMKQLLYRTDAPDLMNASVRYLAAVQNKESLDTMVRFYLDLNNPKDNWPLMSAIMQLAAHEDTEQMLQVLAVAARDEETLARAAGWFRKHRSPEAIRVVRQALEPYAETWSISADIKGLLPGKYTRRFQLTIALAEIGDEEVIAWVQESLHDLVYGRWVAIYAIARSPLPQSERLIEDIIKKEENSDVIHLVEGICEPRDALRWDRLDQIIALSSKGVDLTRSLMHCLNRLTAVDSERAKARLAKLTGKAAP
jgi:HEAT repeat protein